jgi:GAF domain-containing protein
LDLCEAKCGNITIYDGEVFNFVAAAGHAEFDEWVRQNGPARPGPGTTMERMIQGDQVVHVTDIADDDVYRAGSPVRKALVEIGGFHTFLGVALRKNDALLGILHIYRQEVRPFSERQIALLQNFAEQVVIAMENARLLTETREALEQQTATAEVLQVINSSPGDLAPVFDAILEKAHTLCEATTGSLRTIDRDMMRTVAIRGYSGELADVFRGSFSTSGAQVVEALRDGAPFLHITDVAEHHDSISRLFAASGNRAVLVVPLRRDDDLLGMIVAGRREACPFTEKQIALLQNFAVQAVIAMENARLLTETREALEQQTATAEVLQVINSSPGDLAPVFDAILEKAHTLCGAAHGSLQLYDGERSLRAVATHAVSDEFADILRQGYRAADSPASRALIDGKGFIQIADCAEIDHPVFRSAAALSGIRTVLFVPLRKDDAFLGLISAARLEVRPFTDKQIALLQNFAAQAVIAMDNARLLNEIRQRQAELRVTFDNMGDGVAMFDTELRLAAWNRNFQDLLDLPETFLSERPSFGEYVCYLAARGEYRSADLEAELSRAVEDPGRDTRLERTRPDGHIIEVRRNAVPGGGFVLIYGDVTERKRAEEEIRAARDTAERALRELQAAQASLLHAQKMAALGQLTAGIAHEIKNPLNFVNNFAGLSSNCWTS